MKRLEVLLILASALVFHGCSRPGQPFMLTTTTQPITAPPSITTTSLPNGTANTVYSATLQATGGVPPITWSVVSGALPAGVTLDSSTGTISGTPTASGTFNFTVAATDRSTTPQVQQQALSITIGLAVPPLSIVTTSLPNGTVNTFYDAPLRATGGALPITWSLVAGALPSGLTLDSSTGIISGTPTAGGASNFTVAATDRSTIPQVQRQALSITIGVPTPPVSITTISLPSGTVNTAYSATLQATGGLPPITWSVVSGALPAGLTLDSSFGVISGIPTAAGTSTFTVQATDSSKPSLTAQAALSITLNAVPLKITTTSLPAGIAGSPYTTILQASGGTPPVTWSVSLGSLPAGLSLTAATGVISGTPTAAGTTNFSVTAAAGTPVQTAQQALSIIVAAPGTNDAELTGQYAFLLKGFDATGPVAIAGSFVADGKGNLTGGIEDINRTSGVTASLAFTGTYSVSADNRGTMTLTSTLGTSSFTFALGSIVTGVASLGHAIEFDTSGTNVAGIIKKQDTTAFSLAAISGNFATGMSGAGSTGLPYALAGSFTANGLGAISAGTLDTEGLGLIAANTAFTGTYTVAANGRGASTLTVGTSVINQAFYVISANELLMISTDPLSAANAIYGGSVLKQAVGPFTNASLTATSVLHVEGYTSTGASLGVTIQVGVITSTGAGTFTLSADENKAGVLHPISASGTYSVAANGRTAITDVSHSWVIYLVGPNQGFVVDANPSATSGMLEPQTAGPFTGASLLGSFIFGDGTPAVKTSTLQSGVVTADGIANMIGTDDQNLAGVLTGGQALADTYTVAANGRVVLNLTKQIMYIISPSRAVVVSSDPLNTSPNLRVWDK